MTSVKCTDVLQNLLASNYIVITASMMAYTVFFGIWEFDVLFLFLLVGDFRFVLARLKMSREWRNVLCWTGVVRVVNRARMVVM